MLGRPEVPALFEQIRHGEQLDALVVLTARPGETEPAISPVAVRAIVGSGAKICFLPTSAVFRKLATMLGAQPGPRPGGAARLWWPPALRGSDPDDHPLIVDATGAYREPVLAMFAERFAATRPVTRQRVGLLERRLQEASENIDRLETLLGQAVVRAQAAEARVAELSIEPGSVPGAGGSGQVKAASVAAR